MTEEKFKTESDMIVSQIGDLNSDKHALGFWIYLMTDLIMFAVLFASFAVLRNNTFGGPSGADIFNLPYVLTETAVLLISSFVCGLGMISARSNKKDATLRWLALTFLLGMIFLLMEIAEFHNLIRDGNGPQRSAFLSSYFSLVGTHGLHIAIGLIWLAVARLMIQMRGLTAHVVSKLYRFTLFWHFLDLVWIFIFTIVYLKGVL